MNMPLVLAKLIIQRPKLITSDYLNITYDPTLYPTITIRKLYDKQLGLFQLSGNRVYLIATGKYNFRRASIDTEVSFLDHLIILQGLGGVPQNNLSGLNDVTSVSDL